MSFDEWFKILAKYGLIAVAGFFASWLWGRLWGNVDTMTELKTTSLKDHFQRILKLEAGQSDARMREETRQQAIGRLEGEIQRLDGKVGGLQTFWTTKFEKMEEKLEARLERHRTELRSDQEAHEGRMVTTLAEHQERVHNRLNQAAASQAEMLNELVDKLVDKVGS